MIQFYDYDLDEVLEADGLMHEQAIKHFDKNPADAYTYIMKHMNARQRSLIPAEIMETMKVAHAQSYPQPCFL